MPQSTSRLLCLPRELREEIYRYAFLEKDGYRYELKSGRLRTSHNAPINLSLSYTCRQVYSETYNKGLSTNCITFIPQHDSSSDIYSTSNTGRLGRLRRRQEEAFKIMLGWMAEYVTDEHLNTLLSLYPDSDDLREFMSWEHGEKLWQLQHGELLPWHSPCTSIIPTDHPSRSIRSVYMLRDLLRMLSEHDAFYATTAKEYDSELRNGQVPPRVPEPPEGWTYDQQNNPPRYTQDAQKELLENTIEPWWIVDKHDLLRWESLLPRLVFAYRYCPPWSSNSDSDSESEAESEPTREPRVLQRRKYHWSATACAIHFLKALSKDTRHHIQDISIIEDDSTPIKQASQSLGLIPFCKENPRLKVRAQIDICNVLIWNPGYDNLESKQGFFHFLADLLRETLFLPAMGMPQEQYTLELRGRTPEMTQHIWEGIKKIAEIQDAARLIYTQHPDQSRSLRLILHHFPACELYKLVKRVLKGDTAIRLDASICQPWNLEQAVAELERSPENAENWETFLGLDRYGIDELHQ